MISRILIIPKFLGQMPPPKEPNTSTKNKPLHYTCMCKKPRCILKQGIWTLKICKFCEEPFQCTEIPEGHECDRTIYFCKKCKFSSPYKKNLNRHVKQKHPAKENTKVNQQKTKINCKVCESSNFHERNKHKKDKLHIAIQHSLHPLHKWHIDVLHHSV